MEIWNKLVGQRKYMHNTIEHFKNLMEKIIVLEKWNYHKWKNSEYNMKQ